MIYIITGGRSSGKTETLKEFYNKADNPFGFFLSKKTEEGFVTAYDLDNPSAGEKLPLAADRLKYRNLFPDYEENRRFIFNNAAFSYAYRKFKKEISGSGPFFLDEIGRLELEKGRGFYDSLLLLLEISGDKDIYLTVQDSSLLLLSDIIEKKKLEYRIIRKKNIAAVIMASGKSQRFSNENKLLKKINGKALYQITVENVLKADIFSCILLVSGFDEILSGVEKYWNVYPVYNGEGDSGISMSIKKGVEAADSFKTDGYMFIPCDQVLLSPETLKELTVKFLGNSSSITVPVCRGKQVSPCIFPFRFRERLLELSGDKGGKEIIIENSSSVSEAAVSRDQDFFDIDTPDDFYVVKKILESE